VAIVTATIPKAVVVPQAAIVSGEEGGSAVLVIRAGSTVNLQAVEIGVRDGDKLQVLSGVSPGDQVVVVGGAGLDDKAKVRIVKPGEKEEKEEDEKK
jgi:multidrug efflux pump subunit AcrA (membrane-fusion protein)